MSFSLKDIDEVTLKHNIIGDTREIKQWLKFGVGKDFLEKIHTKSHNIKDNCYEVDFDKT